MQHEPRGTPERHTSGWAWAVAVIGPIAISAALVAFRGEIRPSNAALVLVLAVLVAAFVAGRAGGAVAAVVSALCFVAVGELVVRARRSRQVASASRREVEQVRRVAALGAGGEAAGKLIQILQRELVEALGVRDARFERPPFTTVLPRLGHGSVTVPAQANGTPLGPRNEVELPVFGQGRELGRFVLVLAEDSTGISMNPDDRALAAALADQLGAALAATAETT